MTISLVPLSQNDPHWKSKPIGIESLLTIGNYGCLLTCLVMVVNYFGENETPDTLNAKMAAAGGYFGADIVPARIGRVLPNIKLVDFVRCPDLPAPMDRIDAALEGDRPVIVEVDKSPAPGLQSHWVVLYDKIGTDYPMIDPWDGGDALLSKRYAGKPAVVITGVVWMDRAAQIMPRTEHEALVHIQAVCNAVLSGLVPPPEVQP